MKRLIFIGLFLLLNFTSFGQFGDVLSKVYGGGGFGFSLDRNVTSFSVSPYAGYKITNQLSAGLRFPYQRTSFTQSNFRITSFGAGPFGRFQINDRFLAWAEYEYLNLKVSNTAAFPGNAREAFNSLFVGMGISQQTGRNSSILFLVLYNLTWDDGLDSPYSSPLVFRAAIEFGFFN